MSEIQNLVKEFNQTELEQQNRLKELFDLVNDRKGYRRILFRSGHTWVNCWGRDRRDLQHLRFVEEMNRQITEVELGGD